MAVMVITDEEPTEEVLTRILQPWHEYECTGIDDEYVVDVDVTDRVEEEWNSPQKMLKLADGSIHSLYDEMFYIGEPKDEYDARMDRKSFVMPTGAVEIEIPQHEKSALKGETKIEFAEEYGEWKFRDGKFWDHTNPNAKWDWWSIGGRYSGRLQVLNGAESRTGKRSWTNKNETITGVDQAQQKNLNIAAMLADRQKERREWAEDCCTKAERTMDELDIACRLGPVSHAEWMKLEEPRPRGGEHNDWVKAHGGEWEILATFSRACFELPDVPEGMTVTEWIEAAPTVSAWAVVHDGQWIESASMGWWGMSSDDKPDWDQIFNKIWDSIGPDQWISFVDCHI